MFIIIWGDDATYAYIIEKGKYSTWYLIQCRLKQNYQTLKNIHNMSSLSIIIIMDENKCKVVFKAVDVKYMGFYSN